MSTTAVSPTVAPGRALRVSLWVAQALLFFAFASVGLVKLFTPIPQLAAMMPWAGEYSPTIVHAIALIDLAGGIGIILPALTRIMPGLTVLAALGCSVLQVFAMVFHLSRGEGRPCCRSMSYCWRLPCSCCGDGRGWRRSGRAAPDRN